MPPLKLGVALWSQATDWPGIAAAARSLERLDSPTAWLGPPEHIAARIEEHLAIGFGTVIIEAPAPYDDETFERLAREVRPAFAAHGAAATGE